MAEASSKRPIRSPGPTVTATKAKNEFGRLLDVVIAGARVVITKHDTPKAVLLSIDDFTALTTAAEGSFDALSAEFDALLSRMQSSGQRAAMKDAFDASPARLGRAAAKAARTRA